MYLFLHYLICSHSNRYTLNRRLGSSFPCYPLFFYCCPAGISSIPTPCALRSLSSFRRDLARLSACIHDLVLIISVITRRHLPSRSVLGLTTRTNSSLPTKTRRGASRSRSINRPHYRWGNVHSEHSLYNPLEKWICPIRPSAGGISSPRTNAKIRALATVAQ